MYDFEVPVNGTEREGERDFQRERYNARGSAMFIGL